MTKKSIHSNKRHGFGHSFELKQTFICLPNPIYPHGNVEEDRHQHMGGSIANINADGTCVHSHTRTVVEEDDIY